jgi:tetratricopeptide (TPR) repeat protein
MYMQKDMPEKLRNKAALLLLLVLSGWATGYGQTPDEGYMAGMAALKLKNLPDAAEKLTYALSRNNSDDRIYLARGEAYLLMKDYSKAEADFREANEILPGVADIWLARLYARMESPEKAAAMLRAHLLSPFRLPEDSIRKDPAFDAIQDSPEWYSLWEKEWYSAPEKAISEAGYYLKKAMPDLAFASLNKALETDPAAAGLYSQRGRVYLETGNYAAAISDFTSALNMGRRSSGNRETTEGVYLDNSSDILYNRGRAFLAAGRFKDALADFNRLLREEPALFDAYLLRAEAEGGTGSWDQAVLDVKRYLDFFPEDRKAVFQCGTSYYNAEDYINALRCFNTVLREDTGNPLYFKARGKTYLKTATLPYAISDLAMSLDLDPTDGETWMYLGQAKMQTGLKEEACSDFRKAVQLGYIAALQFQVDNCR